MNDKKELLTAECYIVCNDDTTMASNIQLEELAEMLSDPYKKYKKIVIKKPKYFLSRQDAMRRIKKIKKTETSPNILLTRLLCHNDKEICRCTLLNSTAMLGVLNEWFTCAYDENADIESIEICAPQVLK